MSNKRKKTTKRRLIVFGSLSLIAIIYFIVILFTYTLNIKKLKNEEIYLNNKLDNLKENAEELKVEIEKLKDPEYIARFAREEFSYSKEDGEYIIKIEKKDEERATIEQTKSDNNKYIIWGIGGIILLIIIYIIKKR